MTKILNFLRAIYRERGQIFTLARQDFRAKYLGSYLGLAWAFIHPLSIIAILWFVFEVGFKSAPVDEEFPFIIWLITGMIPWFYFAENLSSGTMCVLEYSYLIKKTTFRVSMMPVVKILATVWVHVFFICLIIAALSAYRLPITIHIIQLPYYLFALVFLVLGISWLTSSLTIFMRDVSQMVQVVIQFGFWLTPIFWSHEMLPKHLHFLVYANPIFYFTEGYRNTFLYQTWFWENPYHMIYFWIFSMTTFALGAFTFQRLRPHFADIL